MDSSTLTKKRNDQMIYSWYMNKAIFGQKQNAVADESTILQKDSGGYPLIFNYMVEGPNCCTNCAPTDSGGISGNPYTLDEAVVTSLDALLANIASTNIGPTRSSRVLYLWFMSVVSAYNWGTSGGKITGTKDNWNWDTHYAQANETDLFVWMNRVLVEIMPTFVPGFNTQILTAKETEIFGWTPEVQASEVARIRSAGNWTSWQSAWSTWYTNRQSDGSVAAAAIPSNSLLPNGSQSINVSTTTDNPNTFTAPSAWTPLIVGGVRKNYLTYGWGDVTSTCLNSTEETTILNGAQAFFPGTASSYNDGSARANEIAELLTISQNLTDMQKVIAEFWAGGPNTVSPPGMLVYFWEKYMLANSIAHTIGFDTFFYSGLDLAIHLFEAGRLVWNLKKSNMQARPIQEIRRLYRGQTLVNYDGTSIQGEAWVPYQTSNFVTPPFPDFPSGHSAYSQSFANVMISWFGDQINGKAVLLTDLTLISPPMNQPQTVNFGRFTFQKGQSEIQPQTVPSQDILFSWTQWHDMADSAGISRQYGGIHCTSAHTGSVNLANALHTKILANWAIVH